MSDSLIVFVLCIVTALFLAWVIVLKHRMITLLARESSLRAYLRDEQKPQPRTAGTARPSDPWSAGDVNIRTS